ncbi:hypothetical protein ABZO31_30220 [Streptomyces sp. HUAS MG47]|uniref:hypothetical protein n=1 Tax=Streptomyces solicamelliae TaxID=3231716 RepID=UPI003877B194
MNNAVIGTALVGGYVLGRTKKGKLALGLAMAMAGSRIKPVQLGKSLANSPFLSNVNDQVRGELMTAGKSAATTVLNAKAEHLADALHDRTDGLREGREEEATDDDEHKDEHEDEHQDDGDKPQPRKSSSSGRSTASAEKKPEGTAKRSTRRTSTSGASKSSRSGSTRRKDDG